MRWGNIETPTFAGSAGSGTAPAVAERINLYDRDNAVIGYFDKAVDGTISLYLNGVQVAADTDIGSIVTSFGAASASTATYLDFFEDTDNGTNRARLIGPTSTADVSITLPAVTGTVALIAQTIANGTTTSAPSEDAVFDALALKADSASPTFTGTPVGVMITKMITFTENATNTLHTGTVVIPAGSILHSIQVTSSVLWTGGTATMKVGDSVDDDGYFTGVNLKATDLLVGEVLDTRDGDCWGGKEGVYLTSAGRRGAVATNFGTYLEAGTSIIGVVTVGTPATTAGRTFMAVTYSSGTTSAATASA